MSFAHHPIAQYMSADLETATEGMSLTEASRSLASRRISALPVVDGGGAIVGVVSRYDLLHHRRHHPRDRGATCGEIMSQGPLVVAPDAALGDAARLMIEHRIHRVFVVNDGRLVGVVTTTDLTRAVEEARFPAPIRTIMTSPVVTIRVEQGLALAFEWLDRAHITGLIVTENDWPVGVFTQEDALAARDLPATTEVGTLLDPSLICLPAETAIHRAAAQCARMGVKRIVVSKNHDYVGVVSGYDFAGVVAGAAAEA